MTHMVEYLSSKHEALNSIAQYYKKINEILKITLLLCEGSSLTPLPSFCMVSILSLAW
jgi:hypothetical protein